MTASVNRHLKILIAGRESKGKQHAKHKDKFVGGTYTSEHLTAEKGRLEQIIADYDPQEFPCRYNSSTGQMYHSDNCISNIIDIIDGVKCPEQTYYETERELACLKTRPFLTLAFSDPGIAAVNDLLGGERVINNNP